MKITDISIQARNPNRVNVFIDGKYKLSLDVYQVVELGIKNGMEVTPEQVAKWEEESQFGKLYTRALEYILMRPHSAKEVRDYLWRKTLTRRVKKASRNHDDSGAYEVVERPGVPQSIADRVFEVLLNKGYIDDEKFARFWIENRQQTKGISKRKLVAELQAKGVSRTIIESQQTNTERSDESEIQKVISKKFSKYPDETKLIQYLLRQGFQYDTIKEALLNRADQ